MINGAERVVVLLFVQTDCPISNRYAPTIQKLNNEFRGKANFWLIYPNSSEPPAKIRTHLAKFRYTISALRDTHHALAKRAQATITPESAVFDSKGKLVYHGRIDNWYEDLGRARPAPTTHDLEAAISATLSGRMVVPAKTRAIGCFLADAR